MTFFELKVEKNFSCGILLKCFVFIRKNKFPIQDG